MNVPPVSFDHLSKLSTDVGLYEHAEFAEPRSDHGYCVDDVARGLVVTARQPDPSDLVLALSRTYLDFTVGSVDAEGRCHNRRASDGPWTDEPSAKDHWGRALWGLGTAAAQCTDEAMYATALATARTCLRARSAYPRSMAYAAIGAGEVLRVQPGDAAALDLLKAALAVVGRPTADSAWRWPEPRLWYANAVIPEALLVIGAALDDTAVLQDGLTLLAWLVEQETDGSHLSVTPTSGWSRGEVRPGFDQQPIEVAALAEACFRAWTLTRNRHWVDVLDRCSAWFLGRNDCGLAMYDPSTGGGFDGLLRGDVNLNQGAESTLAAIATFQLAHQAALAPVG